MDSGSSHSHQEAEGHHIAQASDGSTATVYTVDKVYTRSDREELHNHLARAVSAYEARMYQLVARPAVPPDQPYKFLYAFEIEDTDIFFGRDAASEAFHQTVLKDHLTVLHAKSGAGKTSLLNAGLSPCLIREARLPVYARAYEDPIRAIKWAIAPPSEPWPELLSQLTLHEFLSLTCTHLSRQTQELVVILDQFEEFFIFWPEQDHRQPFVDSLADCYEDKSLPIRFIISIRSDYFSHLATFQRRLPHIFHNEYYVEVMTREEAQTAVIGPVAKLGRPVAYEQALLDTLLNDLARGGMELPHLQIVCTQLYKVLGEEETIIALASYEKLGRAEGVLGGYLNSVLNRLPSKGEPIAREVLKELVSSEATKRVLNYDTLAARVEAGEDELKDILTRLVDTRLLRRDEVVGEVSYEMAHEYLIGEIKQWIDQADLAFKQAEELLAREIANWRTHNTLIPRDRLELIYTQRDRFRGWNIETLKLIVRSAVTADFAIEDWGQLDREVGERLLLDLLNDPHGKIRRAATRSLGTIWELPEIFKLGSEDWGERIEAVEAMGGNTWGGDAWEKDADPRAVDPLIAALQDEDGDVRLKAAIALGYLGDRRAVGPLIAILQDEYGNVRQAVAIALGCLGDARAFELVEAALQDETNSLRYDAVSAMAHLGNPRAFDLLISALQDEDDWMREVVVEALEKTDTPEALAALEKWQQ